MYIPEDLLERDYLYENPPDEEVEQEEVTMAIIH